jgi:hypothetical protein
VNLPIKYDPKAFEKRIEEMCKDLTTFIELHGSMSESSNAERLRDELAEFHHTVMKPLIDEANKYQLRAA